jgi:cyclopropane-fatty-acyl-phospholipid synthase
MLPVLPQSAWPDRHASPRAGTVKMWGLYMAGSRLGFESNVVQLHRVLAVKLNAKGDDGGLPLRQWWTP